MRASEFVSEKWSAKYKRSIDCSHPRGFSQKAHCAGRKKNEDLNEFAPTQPGGGNDYLRVLASAWYNDVFNTGDLHKGIKSQEDVERILERGVICPDGKKRKFGIGYNHNFDGVVLASDDYYEYDNGGVDSRTNKPWGPYEYIEYAGNQLDEQQLDELSFRGSQCTKDCSGHRAGYEWSTRKGGADAASWSPSFNKGAWLHNNGF